MRFALALSAHATEAECLTRATRPVVARSSELSIPTALTARQFLCDECCVTSAKRNQISSGLESKTEQIDIIE
jgi:hypothetical protein